MVNRDGLSWRSGRGVPGAWGDPDRGPQTGRLKKETCIVSHFWRPEAQERDMGRVGAFWGPQGEPGGFPSLGLGLWSLAFFDL